MRWTSLQNVLKNSKWKPSKFSNREKYKTSLNTSISNREIGLDKIDDIDKIDKSDKIDNLDKIDNMD